MKEQMSYLYERQGMPEAWGDVNGVFLDADKARWGPVWSAGLSTFRARLVLGWGTAREGCKICTCPMTTERHGQAHGQRILSYVGPATFCCQGSSVKVWPFRPWSRKAQRCRRSVPKPFGASKLGGPSSTAHILDLLSVRSLP